MDLKLYKKTYPFICSKCDKFSHTYREYCEKCGEKGSMVKATKEDYRKALLD